MDKYELFIGRYKELPNEEYTYYSSNSGYMLCYTENDLEKEGFKKVLVDKIIKLPQDERTWLAMIKMSVTAKYLNETIVDTTKRMNVFLDFLEQVLRETQEGRTIN